MTGLVQALLDEIAADPVALARLRELIGPPEEPPELLTLTSAGRMLDRHPKTVKRRIDDGELPAVVEHGQTKVRLDDLRAYIDGLERYGSPTARRRRARPRKSPYARLD